MEAVKSFTVEFRKTVTNVGPADSKYEAKVVANSEINVSVKPSTLSFKSSDEKKSFIVTVFGKDYTLVTDYLHHLCGRMAPIM